MDGIIKVVRESDILIDYFEESVIQFFEVDKELIFNDSIERTMVARIFLYLNQVINNRGSEILKENYFVDMEYARNVANSQSLSLVKQLDDGSGNVQFDLVVHSRGNLKYNKELCLNLDNLLHIEVKKDQWEDENYEKLNKALRFSDYDKQKAFKKHDQFSDCIRLSMTTKYPSENEIVDERTKLLKNILGYQYGIFLTGLTKEKTPEYRLFRNGKIILSKRYDQHKQAFIPI
ncbi:hypothetical protein [Vagococcus fluvialis]|uniref:hypothetical protein n=1 Tax=Vagococcus fluvialis TaxID=2738 RepID=UPI0022E52C60|nr:hypothetical protein [Vagococcus fluvialis]